LWLCNKCSFVHSLMRLILRNVISRCRGRDRDYCAVGLQPSATDMTASSSSSSSCYCNWCHVSGFTCGSFCTYDDYDGLICISTSAGVSRFGVDLVRTIRIKPVCCSCSSQLPTHHAPLPWQQFLGNVTSANYRKLTWTVRTSHSNSLVWDYDD